MKLNVIRDGIEQWMMANQSCVAVLHRIDNHLPYDLTYWFGKGHNWSTKKTKWSSCRVTKVLLSG